MKENNQRKAPLNDQAKISKVDNSKYKGIIQVKEQQIDNLYEAMQIQQQKILKL